jgi:anthraniloyl-CoA monooxygenase
MAEAATEDTAVPPMFTPFTLRDMTVANRVVMSPMCMYTAEDGTVNDFHLVHLGSRAMGGSGLVITEMASVSREGRISPACSGLYKDEHVPAWKRVVDYVHTHTDAKIGAQIAHAGRKGAQARTPEGRNRIMTDDAWPLLAPSAIPFGNDCQVPKEMDADDLEKLRGDFAAAAQRAEQAGFDMVELHCGHGYLLSSFVSPLSNRRRDNYGGSLEARMRLPLEIFRSVREVWPEHKPMSMRISACDWMDGGITGDDSVEMAKMLKDAGLDIIDVSTGNVIPGARPTEGGMFQTPFSDRIRNEVGIPTMTVGNITGAEAVNDIIRDGRADLCALAKGHLYDPYFTRHAARQLGYEGLKWPMQYAAGGGFTPG